MGAQESKTSAESLFESQSPEALASLSLLQYADYLRTRSHDDIRRAVHDQSESVAHLIKRVSADKTWIYFIGRYINSGSGF